MRNSGKVPSIDHGWTAGNPKSRIQNPKSRRGGFTLVELLTVIAIITLLIGILVPSLGKARDQAKRTRTAGLLSTLGKGCEMFQNDTDKYPVSNGANPFENTGTNAWLTGAQWLALQLVGADHRGYVRPISQNDTNNDRIIDHRDWLNWYSTSATRTYPRLGPYVPTEGHLVDTPDALIEHGDVAGPLPPSMTAGSSVWNNERVPLFVDAFNFPVLYYAANAGAEQPFSTGLRDGNRDNEDQGIYDITDNAAITGKESGALGRNPSPAEEDGLDLGAGLPHKMKVLGWSAASPGTRVTRPLPDSFAAALYDDNIFETTQQGTADTGRVWPRRADTFILLTPGRDGVYGTSDDVRNYETH